MRYKVRLLYPTLLEALNNLAIFDIVNNIRNAPDVDIGARECTYSLIICISMADSVILDLGYIEVAK